MSQGFIQLHRKIQDEWFWTNSKYAHAMIGLLLRANHEDKEVTFQGAKRTIKRGEHIATYRDLAEDWGCSKSTIERTLRALKENGEIRIIETKATHIKIIKYDYYLNDDFVPMMGNSRDKHGTRESLNNNDNNENKINTMNIADLKTSEREKSATEEIMEDEGFINGIIKKFHIGLPDIKDEIYEMESYYEEKCEKPNSWKPALKTWLIRGKKIEKNINNRMMDDSGEYYM